MEGAVRDTTLAEVAVSAVQIRGVHVVPVRHHSPAIARATAAILRALRPRLVLIEGPSDANHLIAALTAPDAVAPLAILAYRQPQARQASADLAPEVVFYPFCDYSPELAALRTARELGIEAQFCDIPAAAVLKHREATDEAPPSTAESPAPQALEPHISVYDRVAQRMGFDDSEEWWECLFETALSDSSQLLLRAFEWGQLVIGDFGISDYDALRNAYMWKRVEESGAPPEQIVLVVGAAHAAAFAQPNFTAEYDPNHPLLQARPAEFVLTPYSFPRLSEQLGYGAGNRAPQFYQDAWEFGSLEEATLATLTRLVNSMKLQGDIASHADAIEAFRLAKQLATLRGKLQPGYRETIDAAIAAFGRGQAERVEKPLKRLMIGERVGRAPHSETQPPVQAEFYRLAHELRIPIKDDPNDLLLNLAEPHAVQQSIFLHRLAVAKIPFAELQSGEAATYRQMARLREKWRLQWTPLTDVALTEAVIFGDTLREVAKRKIEPRLAQREQLAQVSVAALEAVLCELPELYGVALQALDEASIRDGDFVSLARAAYQMAGLIEYGAARAVHQAMFEPLLQRVYTRACLHLLPASDCGEDEARAIGEGMQLLHELAHKLPYLETELWMENLRETVLSERAQAYVVGLGLGLLGFVRDSDEALWLRARRMLSPATPPESAAAFLEGLLQAQGGAATRSRPFVHTIHEFVMSLPNEQFIQALPMLRRAFTQLSNHDIHYLTDNILRLLEPEAEATEQTEATIVLAKEEVEHIWAQLAWLG
ncbi:MAG: hypothetical protein KatS3mg017_0292 [Fimbriimonadales bacterium]|nr:MAG: hypothetical protein KatS3mg017_0292 [Fimbriimonadales bacterium]